MAKTSRAAKLKQRRAQKDPGDFRQTKAELRKVARQRRRQLAVEKAEGRKTLSATMRIIAAATLIIGSFLPKNIGSSKGRKLLQGSKLGTRKGRILANIRNGKKVLGYLWQKPDGKRLRTLFSGQWADMKLPAFLQLAKSMGFQGVELAMWHIDRQRALHDDDYIASILDLFKQNGLELVAISDHLVGQAVCDKIDSRHKAILPTWVWGNGIPHEVNERAAIELMNTGRVAARLKVKVVNGFTGSSIWPQVYDFPPTPASMIDEGYKLFADRFTPILDLYAELGVVFALEVHPTEIAFDLYTAKRALDAIEWHPAFGFNFDPSHLLWQGVDPAEFILEFGDRIYHCHMKDAEKRQTGKQGILVSYFTYGDFFRRGWDFVSVGRGQVNFSTIIRALNKAGYWGPLSVEWEDCSMDRVQGATESCAYVAKCDFMPSGRKMDESFQKGKKKKKAETGSNKRPGSLVEKKPRRTNAKVKSAKA